jgi:uncharacterized membrane-anchored protein
VRDPYLGPGARLRASRVPPKLRQMTDEGIGRPTPSGRRGRFRRDRTGDDALLPVLGRIFPAPLAAKVPEIIALFWVVKILTTAGGEATSDYLKTWGNLGGGGTEIVLFLIAIVLQFATRRYRALAYWFLAYAIATAGTGISDFLHLDVHIPYAGTTILWAVILIAVFVTWQRREGTLSIHSITTQRREGFYWATVFATFALGTALGDFTATSLNLGYLASGILFGVIILIPAVAWWKFRLNAIAAFWFAYVLTRPLGASFADYISRPRNLSGIGFGDGPTALVFAAIVAILVTYLAIARPDIQHLARAPQERMTDIASVSDAAGPTRPDPGEQPGSEWQNPTKERRTGRDSGPPVSTSG